MTVKDTITASLRDAFRPTELDVIDESHLHAGHAGARPQGETHFRVSMTADAFTGLSRVGRHRLVNAALAAELRGPVHALALHLKAPGETGR